MWQNAGFWWCCAEIKQTGKLPRWTFKVHLFWGCLGGSDKWQKCDVADPSFQPFLPPPPLPALSPPWKRPNQFAQSYAFDTNAPLHLFHCDEKLLWKVLQGIRRSLTVKIGKTHWSCFERCPPKSKVNQRQNHKPWPSLSSQWRNTVHPNVPHANGAVHSDHRWIS